MKQQIEDQIEFQDDDYNRERTLAVLTGLICMCVSLGGTALGSYHAVASIGVIAGLFATFAYIITDLVVYWAARIDYKEDGNALEWTSWAVKYILSAYLLITGGLVAYTLFDTSAIQESRSATTKRAQSVYDDCIKGGSKAYICQRMYDSTLKAESDADQKKSDTDDYKAQVTGFISFPLFNYIPGLLGLAGAIALTFVSKLMAKKRKPDLQTKLPTTQGSVKMTAYTAPLRIEPKRYGMVSNGKCSFRFRKQRGIAGKVQVSWRGNGKELFCLSILPSEADLWEKRTYNEIANDVIDYMKVNGGDWQTIEHSL